MADTGAWRTPIGDAPICEPLAAALLKNCALLTADRPAHSLEHSLEVQVPFLLRRNPNVQIVPILIGRAGRKELREIGGAIARTIQGKDRNYTGAHFWARGYAVSTIGFDEEIIKKYIREQDEADGNEFGQRGKIN